MPPEAGIFEIRFCVTPADIDVMDHVDNVSPATQEIRRRFAIRNKLDDGL